MTDMQLKERIYELKTLMNQALEDMTGLGITSDEYRALSDKYDDYREERVKLSIQRRQLATRDLIAALERF